MWYASIANLVTGETTTAYSPLPKVARLKLQRSVRSWWGNDPTTRIFCSTDESIWRLPARISQEAMSASEKDAMLARVYLAREN